MNLKEIINGCKCYAVKKEKKEVVDGVEKDMFNSLVESLLDEDDCQIIYRGEQKVYVYEKTGVTPEKINENNFNALLEHGKSVFYLGAKADSYLYGFNNVEFPIRIDDVSKDLFEKIFNEIKTNFTNLKAEDNLEFISFFNEINIKKFISIIGNLNDEEKWLTRLYYLWYLHTSGTTEYKKYSNFLSTSKSYKIAEEYSEGELVYIGWIPRPIKNRSVYLGSLMNIKKRLESLHLPTYENEPFPDEKEISLLGGFFPQYILGIYQVEEQELLINQNIFEKENSFLIKNGMSDLIVKLGFSINQSNFAKSDIYQKSAYSRYLSYSEENGYTEL